MAAPLACDCVAGYAQRKYEFLGQFLSKQISQEVNVYWAESIKVGMQEAGRAPRAWRVSEWLAASLEMKCPVRGCGFESRALRASL
jgi:hypothetical protein